MRSGANRNCSHLLRGSPENDQLVIHNAQFTFRVFIENCKLVITNYPHPALPPENNLIVCTWAGGRGFCRAAMKKYTNKQNLRLIIPGRRFGFRMVPIWWIIVHMSSIVVSLRYENVSAHGRSGATGFAIVSSSLFSGAALHAIGTTLLSR